MGAVDYTVITANLAGAILAVVINIWAAERGFMASRPLMMVTAVIAGMYAIGYAMLLAGAIPYPAFSQFFRGVSVIVWPVVWCRHAFLSIQMYRRLHAEVHGKVERSGRVRSGR